LSIETESRYLGFQLSSKNGNFSHVSNRKKKSIVQIAKLKNLGLLSNNLSPDARAYLFKTYLRPVILYGVDCCDLTENEVETLCTAEGNALKNTIGLNKQVRTTPLFISLNIETTRWRILKDKIMLFDRLATNVLVRELIINFDILSKADSPWFDLLCFLGLPKVKDIDDLRMKAKTKLSIMENDNKALIKLDEEGIKLNEKIKLLFKSFKEKWYIFRMWDLIGFKANKRAQPA